MPDREVIDKYHGLTQMEDQFREMKSTLETRPDKTVATGSTLPAVGRPLPRAAVPAAAHGVRRTRSSGGASP